MRAFELLSAENARHAAALLAEHGPSARLLAGGTDLLVELKSAPAVPRLIIDLSRAEDLKRIAVTEEGLSIGALVTHAQIMRSPLIRDEAPVLVDAAHAIGAAQTRNLGTLGGNLVTGVPSMDSGPALFALDAQLTLVRATGRRRLAISDFFVGPRKSVLEPDELLSEILIPAASLRKPARFEKVGLRKGQALALVNVAASMWIDWDTHSFVTPRIALGAVAPTVMRAHSAEALLEGQPVTLEAMAEAACLAAGEARPIDDFRASAWYRRDLVAVLARRALFAAHGTALRMHEAGIA